jgi:hypothetical protein
MSGNLETDLVARELQNLALDSEARNNKRIRSALLLAALAGVLLWKTQWPAIYAGLIVLLTGQLALAAFLAFRNRSLKRQIDVNDWFDKESSAMRQSAWLDNGSRLLGFVLLGVGFWRATHNLLISLALGIIYPVATYWGLSRVSSRRAELKLNSERQRLQELGPDAARR